MAKKRSKARYRVLTWDTDKQQFTPQVGVRQGPYTLFGLRRALRALRAIGYDVSRSGGFAVHVSRIEGPVYSRKIPVCGREV